MYKIYKFDHLPTQVYVIGDLHGEFKLLKHKIKQTLISNSVIIVAGDCGFGFEKPEHYVHAYNDIKKILIKQNVMVLFIRGNHDNPDYFNQEMIDFEMFKTIPDYSILMFHQHNILCIGGAISVDRFGRKIYDDNIKRKGKKTYWENEPPIYDPEILNKIKTDGYEINTLITHTSPDFAPLTDKLGIEKFSIYDRTLINDVNIERQTITKIYNHLVKQDKHPVKLIVHGHFHKHCLTYTEEDVKIIMLDRVRTEKLSWDIYPIER